MRLGGMRLKRSSRGWLAALGTAFVLGGLLALPQGAKATLIGDTISVSVFGIVDPSIFVTDITVAPFLPEIQSKLTASGGTNIENFLAINDVFFGFAEGTSFIDIDSTSITVLFAFGGNVELIFSDLDWVGPEGAGSILSVSKTLLQNGPFTPLVNPMVTTAGPPNSAIRDVYNCLPGSGCVIPVKFRLDIATSHGGQPVPEPGTLALFGVGLLGLGLLMLRRRRQAA